MRTASTFLGLVILYGGLAGAQPADGDLIVVVQNQPAILIVNPTTGRWSTLAPPAPPIWYFWARMAADNHHVLAIRAAEIMAITPGGVQTTLVRTGSSSPGGPRLDFDGKWILTAGDPQPVERFWAMDDASYAITTLFNAPMNFQTWSQVAIDRDPGGPPYVFASLSDTLFACDRRGILATLHSRPAWGPAHAALNPSTGDYLVGAYGLPQLSLITKNGIVTTLPGPGMVFSCRFDDDNTAWIVHPTQSPVILRIDMKGTVITQFTLKGAPGNIPVDIEIYGSRRLVCRGSGKPGTSVRVTLQSQKPGDARKPYALACSLARRPGFRFPSREWLHLAPDSVFQASALGWLPQVFSGFQGITSASGRAVASVQLPASLPAGLGITVFVAGIIFDGTGLRSVTNTHWFVLS